MLFYTRPKIMILANREIFNLVVFYSKDDTVTAAQKICKILLKGQSLIYMMNYSKHCVIFMVMKRHCMNNLVCIYTTTNGTTSRECAQHSLFETLFNKKTSLG